MQAVLDESEELLRAERGVLICVTRHGLVCANAGVDQSNAAAGELVLLPADPDASARALRAGIEAERGVRPAVIVTDSFGRAWRLGQTDVALGAAGTGAPRRVDRAPRRLRPRAARHEHRDRGRGGRGRRPGPRQGLAAARRAASAAWSGT